MELKKLMTEAQKINEEYASLGLDNVFDYEKYKIYSIVTASTAMEGSTLTEIDTQILLDDGIVAAGKPLEHHLMVKDNYEAMIHAMKEAQSKAKLSPEFLCTLNSINMRTTGQIVHTALGTLDGRTGAYRITPAFSEALGYYLNPQKIPEAVINFCNFCNEPVSNLSPTEILRRSFEAHANLIVIHPWYDGNKRTSRLVMNFLQKYNNLPLTKIDKRETANYIFCLKTVKEKKDFDPLNIFMFSQHIKCLKEEIHRYRQQDNGSLQQAEATDKLQNIKNRQVKSTDHDRNKGLML